MGTDASAKNAAKKWLTHKKRNKKKMLIDPRMKAIEHEIVRSPSKKGRQSAEGEDGVPDASDDGNDADGEPNASPDEVTPEDATNGNAHAQPAQASSPMAGGAFAPKGSRTPLMSPTASPQKPSMSPVSEDQHQQLNALEYAEAARRRQEEF